MVRLTAETVDPLAEIDRQSEPGNNGPVLLVGVEDVFRAGTEGAFLAALNLQRTDWPRRVARPMVFWVPSWIAGELLRGAPDFFDWRSDTLTFTTHRGIDLTAELGHLRTGDDPRGGDSRLTADQRRRRIEELRSRIRLYEATDDPATLRALGGWLGELASHLLLVGEVDEALRIRQQEELPVYARLGNLRSRAATLGEIADLLQFQGNLEEALRILQEEVLPVCERLGDARPRAVTLGRIAGLLEDRGQLDEALRIYQEEVLPVYERLDDVRSRAVTLGKISGILTDRGQLDEALDILQQEELPVYEQLGDIRSRALTLGNIADILEARGNLDEALRIRQQEELPVWERLGDIHSRAVTLGKIADILAARGQLDEALRIRQQEELPVYEKVGDIRSRAVILGRIAQILAERGEETEAKRLQEERLEVNRRLGSLNGISATQFDLARLELAAGQISSALPRLTEAWRLVTTLGQPTGIALVGHLLGSLALEAGDFDLARDVLARSRDAWALLGRTAKAQKVESLLARAELKLPAGADEPEP